MRVFPVTSLAFIAVFFKFYGLESNILEAQRTNSFSLLFTIAQQYSDEHVYGR